MPRTPEPTRTIPPYSATLSGTDHSLLANLNADDHPQYHNDARALTWLNTQVGTLIQAQDTALQDISDVTGQSTGDLLRWDGANWVNYPDSNYTNPDHPTLTNLAWGSSGHTGTNNTIPYFGAAGAASLNSNLTWTGTELTIPGSLQLNDADNSNWVRLATVADQSTNITLTMPEALGVKHQLMHSDGSGTLSFDWADRVIVLARNASGITINQGDPVYVTGYNSGQERVEVAAADAASAATMPAMGLAAETMLNNSNGTVLISGFLEDGDTSTYSVGDGLYVASGGGLTATKPTGTALIQNIAFVLESAVAGTLVVLSPGRTNDVPNLAQDTAWHGNASGVTVASNTPRTLGWKALEQATTPATAATEGTYWVKNDVPTTPWFTDDTNAPHQLAYSAAPLSGIADADSDFLVGTGSGWVVESGDTARTSLELGTGDTPQFVGVYASGGRLTLDAGWGNQWLDGVSQVATSWADTSGNFTFRGDGTIIFQPGLSSTAWFRTAGGLQIAEKALAPSDVAGRGCYWVKDDIPNTPWYTNDTGVDNQLAYASTPLAGIADADSDFLVGTGSGWVVETGNTARTSLGLGTGDSPTWTQATLTGTGAVLDFSSGSSKYINMGTGTITDPTYTSYSAGTRLVLYDNVSASNSGVTLGVGSTALWFTIGLDSALRGFDFFSGTTRSASIRGKGDGLEILERASLGANPSAGFGRYWVRSDTPNVPMFSDDGSTAHQLAYIDSSHSGLSDLDWTTSLHTGGINQIPYFDGAGAATDSANFLYDGTDLTITGGGVKLDNAQKVSWTNTGTEKAYILGSPAASSGSLDLFADTSLRLHPGNAATAYFQTAGGIQIVEKATSTSAVSGRGVYWVKNDNPNTPWFKDDGGTDHQLAYVSTVTTVTTWKDPCRVASDTNITLAGGAPDTVGGIALAVDDRIMVPEQTAGAENGIYYVSTLGTGANGTWTRAEDFDSVADDNLQAGVITYVQEGDHAQTRYTLVTTGTITLDTTALVFIEERPVVRSDAAGTDVIGSSGTPTTLTPATTYIAQSGTTDTRDYRDAVWYATIANKGTATKIRIKVEWLEDGTNLSAQGTEAIASGLATLSVYEAEFDITGESAPFNLPAISLPTAGPDAKVSIISDAGTTTTAYVRVWRKA